MVEGIPRQGEPGWYEARNGDVTGSNFACTLVKGKSKSKPFGDAAYTLAYQIIGERLTGKPFDPFHGGKKPWAMEWGNEHEPKARAEYQYTYGVDVPEYGYQHHPEHARIGGSVDGLVGSDGIIEIKCPETSKEHVWTAYNQQCPPKYLAQVQGYLWIMGRAWCDFISFDPRMPDGLKLYVVRTPRDDKYIANLQQRVLAFAKMVDDMEEIVRGRAKQS